MKEKLAIDSLKRYQADSIKNHGETRLKELKKKYAYTDLLFMYDDFTEHGYYSVQTEYDYKKPKWAKLWLRILDNGDVLFASVYFSRERLYHTAIQAKIGDSIFTSQQVPLSDYSNIVEGRYVESVYFTNRDNGILNAIISSAPNEIIRIRLLGESDYTYTITKKDIIKLKEGFEFAGLLKKLKLSPKEQHDLVY